MIAAAGALTALWLGHASEAATPSATPHDGSVELAGEAAPAAPADTPAVSAAPEPAMQARTLRGVRTETTPQGTLVHLEADGALEGVESFTLKQPARLVIDLPGVRSQVPQNLVKVESGHVKRIRIGQHEGKVRVVLDGGAQEAAFDGRRIEAVPGGLVVALGGADPATAAAAPAQVEGGASSTAAAPAPADAVQVREVTYTSGETADRVVVMADRAVDYQVMRPDPKTLMLVVPGATLAPEAATQVAPETPGPVSLVSVFQQPDLAKPEVRIVIERAAGLEPEVSREGDAIVLAFERGEATAAALPMNAEQSAHAEERSAPAAPEAPSAAARKAVASAAALPANAEPSAAELEGGVDPIDQLVEGGLLDGKEYVGRRISLDFKDVDIRDVLRLIADVSDLNIIAGDEVTGNVTIRLVDVPWDQALDVILLTKGLGFVRVGNVLRIAPSEVLKAEEEARLQERRAKEKLEDLVVKLQPVNYAKVSEVAKLVKRLLTARGTVDTDERTNTIIIKDIPSVIDEATALVKAIDSQTPQVMIEARIVEASLDFSKEIGTEWGFGSQPDEDEDDFTIGGMKPITVQDSQFPFNQANNAVVSNPITLTPAGLMNLGAFLLDDRFNVDVRIAAAELNGEGKVISSPRVVTLDNREAVIEQGVSIPFQTFENGDAQLEFIDAVLSLKVTPHITADRSIIMAIEVSRNAPDSSIDTPTGSPAIAKNQAKTETLVKDGQTLVLGGIYVIERSESSQRVPGLWKIPVLGNAFRNFDTEDRRRELLIFVTPSVVMPAGAVGG
ncbi:MAG TPA: type IV pilus secretin PilQ [Myxococcota bacterium]